MRTADRSRSEQSTQAKTPLNEGRWTTKSASGHANGHHHRVRVYDTLPEVFPDFRVAVSAFFG